MYNQSPVCFNTASGMRSHVTVLEAIMPTRSTPGFNTASGMRSHATLCLGGRRNRRLKSRFWKTSSKPNVRSHFFSCHYIPREYVMSPPSLMQQDLRRFEENRKTYPVFSPLRGFPIFTLPCFFIFVKHVGQPEPHTSHARRPESAAHPSPFLRKSSCCASRCGWL